MPLHRRTGPLLAITATALLLFLILHNSNVKEKWRDLPQHVGLGEAVPDDSPSELLSDVHPTGSLKPVFTPGTIPSPNHTYTKTLVVPKTKDEDVQWISELLPSFQTAIYEVDDPSAPLHPPKNKGHEVMVYLSYIIDHYDALPDVSIFIHSHRWAWHNNELLDQDTAQMLQRLSAERVTREGYMNLRCHWDPGCPDWMRPGATEEDINKQEQTLVAKAWSEIFPLDPIPEVLAQPCCAQFAISRDRIRGVPLGRYVWYRDWLLRTPLSDYISGRVWEYVWQFVFTGQNVVCPSMHVCYCDGYGVCFESEEAFNGWFEIRYNMREREEELKSWQEKGKKIQEAMERGELDEASQLEVPELGRDETLQREIDELRTQLEKQRQEAMERGNDPAVRAAAAGREWFHGDGF